MMMSHSEPLAQQRTTLRLRPVLRRKQEVLPFQVVPITHPYQARVLVDRLRRERKLTAWDTETVDCNVEEESPVGKAVCVSFALCFEEGKAFYVPCYGPYLELLQVFAPWLEDETCPKAGHNIRYDMHVAQNHGITVRGVVLDSQVADWLHNENAISFKLEDCVDREFGEKYPDFLNSFVYRAITKGKAHRHVNDIKVKDLKQRIDPQSQHYEPGKLMYYGAKDAWIEYRLAMRVSDKLDAKPWLKDEQKRVTATMGDYYDRFEARYLLVLYAMERRGITVDVAHMQTLDEDWRREMDELEREFLGKCAEAGAPQKVLKDLNLNSTQQLTNLFFKVLKLPPGKKTPTGAYKFDKAEIERLTLEGHDVFQPFSRWRSLGKLRGTYAVPLQKVVDKHRRVYTSFKQHGTVTGRISSDHPNLMNIPARTKDGERLRQGFTARPGMVLICADLSQIELRILAHYSQDHRMVQGFLSGEDFHAVTARDMFPELRSLSAQEVKDKHPKLRSAAKAINFGINYGMGPDRLALQLKISKEVATEYIKRHDRTFPGINTFRKFTIMRARSTGYVQTYSKRFRNCPNLDDPSEKQWIRMERERQAFNSVIQGSAADIIKMAMILIHEDEEVQDLDAHLLLQVHDELVMEARPEHAERVKEIMVHYMQNPYEYFGLKPLRVPTVSEAKIANTWLEAK